MSLRLIALLGGTALLVGAAVVLIYETRDDGALRPAEPSSAPAAIAPPRSPAAQVSAPALPATPSLAPDPAPAAEPVVTTTDIDEATGSGLAFLADAMAQHHWPDAAAACTSSQVAQAGAASCTLAACQMHDVVRARMYFAAVSSDGRDAVKSSCAELHVPVDRPVPHMPFRSRFRRGG